MWVQARIPPSLAVLHNYIRLHDTSDVIFRLAHELESRGDDDTMEPIVPPEYLSSHITPEERSRAVAKRDQIAQECWDQYVAYLAEDHD